jgi:branched-chain amino acid transport system ATP-binding protein
LLLDEPMAGMNVEEKEDMARFILDINEERGITVVLMEGGRIVLEGETEKLRDNEDVKEFYLGLTEVGRRKSYRDVKHYKRRKRWLS